MTLDDIQQAFPGVLVCRVPKGGLVYMTPVFLLHVLDSFYEHLNVRAVRRSLASLYMSNCLSFPVVLDNGENGLGWAVAAIPKTKVLSFVMGRALDDFLTAKVQEMEQKLFVYCGQGVRIDGNLNWPSALVSSAPALDSLIARTQSFLASVAWMARCCLPCVQ